MRITSLQAKDITGSGVLRRSPAAIADWNYQRVSSPFARIYLVKGGTAKLHLPDKVQILLPGHLYIIPPFTFHSYECDGDFSLCITFTYTNPSRR